MREIVVATKSQGNNNNPIVIRPRFLCCNDTCRIGVPSDFDCIDFVVLFCVCKMILLGLGVKSVFGCLSRAVDSDVRTRDDGGAVQ